MHPLQMYLLNVALNTSTNVYSMIQLLIHPLKMYLLNVALNTSTNVYSMIQLLMHLLKMYLLNVALNTSTNENYSQHCQTTLSWSKYYSLVSIGVNRSEDALVTVSYCIHLYWCLMPHSTDTFVKDALVTVSYCIHLYWCLMPH
jgi:uncharacterized protein YhhL (DUF1145 family)